MRFVARMDDGGPDNTTVLNAPTFRDAASQVAMFRPGLQRLELKLVSEANAGGGLDAPASALARLWLWLRRCFA